MKFEIVTKHKTLMEVKNYVLKGKLTASFKGQSSYHSKSYSLFKQKFIMKQDFYITLCTKRIEMLCKIEFIMQKK